MRWRNRIRRKLHQICQIGIVTLTLTQQVVATPTYVERAIDAYKKGGVEFVGKQFGLYQPYARILLNDIRHNHVLPRTDHTLLDKKEYARITDHYMTHTVTETLDYVRNVHHMRVSRRGLYKLLDAYGKDVGLHIRKSDRRFNHLYMQERNLRKFQ